MQKAQSHPRCKNTMPTKPTRREVLIAAATTAASAVLPPPCSPRPRWRWTTRRPSGPNLQAYLKAELGELY